MVPDISWWALDGNKHIFVPSFRLVHRCTRLNSQYSPASEFTVKSLVMPRKFSPGGGGGWRGHCADRFQRGSIDPLEERSLVCVMPISVGHSTAGGDFGRGEFCGENFAVKKSGEIPPNHPEPTRKYQELSGAHREITASSRIPGGGGIFPFRNCPCRNCPLETSPSLPCTALAIFGFRSGAALFLPSPLPCGVSLRCV